MFLRHLLTLGEHRHPILATLTTAISAIETHISIECPKIQAPICLPMIIQVLTPVAFQHTSDHHHIANTLLSLPITLRKELATVEGSASLVTLKHPSCTSSLLSKCSSSLTI